MQSSTLRYILRRSDIDASLAWKNVAFRKFPMYKNKPPKLLSEVCESKNNLRLLALNLSLPLKSVIYPARYKLVSYGLQQSNGHYT